MKNVGGRAEPNAPVGADWEADFQGSQRSQVRREAKTPCYSDIESPSPHFEYEGYKCQRQVYWTIRHELRIESFAKHETPHRLNSPLDKMQVTRTFWQISVNFKRLRVKETKKRLAAAAEQERARLAASGLLLEERSVYRDEAADTDGELSDLELGPRVKWPARRPYQMKNVHKGSGVPHRKKHRWKH
ncbi:hypothetical protein AK812_SmicGene29099 [Symbiodinium microadriaticum]|uniref:Uncharacterized protein n=1 Tax=Symbiodinium microadriaticum TaxID=2951 RepID=A0A1Q9D2T0_SYMMI|nr:hypothetical protein AK812_SmicGene29099 [Symbiodinium microadriaticum]